MRERMAYLLMIGMLILLIIFVFAVIGRGEYQPPSEEQEQGSLWTEPLERESTIFGKSPPSAPLPQSTNPAQESGPRLRG